MDIEFSDPEKAVNKFNPDKPLENKKEVTTKELAFIDNYLECGNATASYFKAFPEEAGKKSPVQCRAAAHYYVVKFKLKGKSHSKIRKQNLGYFARNDDEIINFVKKQYEMGFISEDELFKRMNDLSLTSTADATRLSATKELRQWVREAKSEIEANKLSSLEIVPLMVDALVDLPKSKYIQILEEVRTKRSALRREKNIIYNPDAIREEQRTRLINQRNINVS